MKKIVHLINGEMVIGDVESEYQEDTEFIIYNPMYIVQTVSDMMSIGFKLEDVLLFSKDDYIALQPRNIVAVITPSDSISEYHTSAVQFNALVVKPVVENQIAESILHVRDSIDSVSGKTPKNSRFKRSSIN